MKHILPILLLASCGPSTDTAADIEPIQAPDDPAQSGVPVGVQTHVHNGVTLEVWYPTTDAMGGSDTEMVDFGQFLPESFTTHVGAVTLPAPDSRAIRDAPVRNTGEPMPVLVFSHGFGGFRLQSFDLTVHLASRGYIVVATDHPGRMMGDILPCLFSPPLDGCDLSGFVSDPAEDDIPQALNWLETNFAAHADLDRLGLFGHSAGGNSTTTVGSQDERFSVLLPMAGGSAVQRDVPTLFVDGSCDGIVAPSSTRAAAQGSTNALHARIEGAGHLAFSDMCALELDALADVHLADRDDLNKTYYTQLLALGVDGCEGAAPLVSDDSCADAFLDLETSAAINRALTTRWFDQHLQGSTDAVDDTTDPNLRWIE